MIGVAVLALLATAAGHAVVGRLAPGTPPVTRMAWGWVLGQGLVSLSAGVCLLAGLPPEASLAAPVLLLAGMLLAGLRRRTSRPAVRARDPWLLATVLGVAVCALGSAATSTGLGWDGLAIWGLKARVIADTGTLPIDEMRHPLALPSHPEYPLHLPLLAAVGARLDGLTGGVPGLAGGVGQVHRVLPLLAALDIVAIALLLVTWLDSGEPSRRTWNRIFFAAGMLLPLAWGELGEGKADLTLALCLLASVVAAGRWLEGGCRGTLWIAALAAGIGAWTKQEGLVWLLIVALVTTLLASRQRRPELLPAAALALVVAAPWHLLRLALGIETEPFALGLAAVDRLPEVLVAMARTGADLGTWSLLWLLAVPALVLAGRRAARDRHAPSRLLPGLVLVLGVGAICAIFLATPHDLDWHLQTALDRLLLQWWPVALLVIDGGLGPRRMASPAARDSPPDVG